MQKLKVLDLFSGIGGFSLGLERTGYFETVAFCEIEPFCQKVLAKHWPDVPIHTDIRGLSGDQFGPVDVICGGFPCQDISIAGRGAGIDGAKSGLWREYARLISEIRPRYAIVENTAVLTSRGLLSVLGDIASVGHDAVWHCIPSSAVGGDHQRDRIWITTNAHSQRQTGGQDVNGKGSRAFLQDFNRFLARKIQTWENFQPDADAKSCVGTRIPDRAEDRAAFIAAALCREADALPGWVDAIGALGNAVDPFIPELIGYAIAEAEGLTG